MQLLTFCKVAAGQYLHLAQRLTLNIRPCLDTFRSSTPKSKTTRSDRSEKSDQSTPTKIALKTSDKKRSPQTGRTHPVTSVVMSLGFFGGTSWKNTWTCHGKCHGKSAKSMFDDYVLSDFSMMLQCFYYGFIMLQVHFRTPRLLAVNCFLNQRMPG